ncbi:MAG: 3'(2'),5'-bisphosphate nucleotidase CysQ [Pseudomonadota bacterium]
MTLPSLEADHDALCGAIRKTGLRVKERYLARDAKVLEKQDRSPLTEADLEANDMLYRCLMEGERRHYGWLSEESAEDPKRFDAQRTWIIDPIDGTRSFIEGRPEFTICGALLDGKDLVSSAIYNPITEEFFEATKGGGAFCNGRRLQAAPTQALNDASIIANKAMFMHPGWPRPWPQMRHAYKNSTSYRLALVAAGAFDATLALIRKAEWDTAPGTLIAQEAGAKVTDHLGKAFTFNQVDPVHPSLLCTCPHLYDTFRDRLNHLPEDLRHIKI